MLPQWPLVRAHCIARSIVYYLDTAPLGQPLLNLEPALFPEHIFIPETKLKNKDYERICKWAAARWKGWSKRYRFPYAVIWYLECLNEPEQDMALQILEKEYALLPR